MSLQDFTLPVHYIRQIADQVGSMGANVSQWLKQNGLSEADLHDPEKGLSFPAFRQLILDALAVTQDPALGLLIGERLLVNTHGMLGFAVMSAATIRQAVDLFERFIPVRTTLVSTRHEVHGQAMRVVFHEPTPLGDIQRPVLEAIMLTVKNVFDQITMGACQVGSVAFPFAEPDYADLARDMFNSEVRYGQSWAGFTLPLTVLDEPLKMADPTTFAQAAMICQRELDKLTKHASLATRVRRVMLEKQNGFPSLNVTARLFHLTPRTLHRHLLDEGTSYKEILEEVRHMLALEHLKSSQLTIQEIAYTLGYTDMANFRRAFKRWETIPPSEYRERYLASNQASHQPSSTV